MERKPVSSSNLASVGYDPDLQQLEVEFKTGAVYQYDGVPAETYQSMLSASSLGKFFHENIRKYWAGKRV